MAMIQYLIPKNAVVFEEEIKKSRFITYIQHVDGIAAARDFWNEIKAQHPNARHHCWAAVAGAPDDSQQLGFSDDGEPAGTAGKPMLAALQGSGLGEVSVVVVRYFGGVLLGTGGLVRAYNSGVQQGLKLLETTIKIQRKPYLLYCDYHHINPLQLLCEQYDIVITQQDFLANVRFELAISDDKVTGFSQEIGERFAGQLKLEPLIG